MAIIFQWEKSDKHIKETKEQEQNKEHKIVMSVLRKIKQDVVREGDEDEGPFHMK